MSVGLHEFTLSILDARTVPPKQPLRTAGPGDKLYADMSPIRLLGVLAAASYALSAQGIEGTVTGFDGAPIAGVTVTLTRALNTLSSTTTGSKGAFHFDAPAEEDEYSLAFSKRGFTPTRLVVHAGGRAQCPHVNAHLSGETIISGRVVDSEGNPVASARIQYFISGRMAGHVFTEENGDYSIRAVARAQNALCAVPPDDMKPPAPEEGVKLTWVRTCYPAASSVEAAQPLSFVLGTDLAGYRIQLLAAPARSLKGIVITPAGVPAARAVVGLGLKSAITPDQTLISEKDGSFEFPLAAAGQWRVSAWKEGANGLDLRAVADVTIAEKDIDDLKLRLAEPFEIREKVFRETAKGLEPSTETTQLLFPEDDQRPAMVKKVADGSMIIGPLYPGIYTFGTLGGVSSAGAIDTNPYYLDSLRLGDEEISPTQKVELSAGAGPITAIYRARTGAIRATLDCDSAAVIGLPVSPQRTRRIERMPVAGGGQTVEVSAIPPGEYNLFAVRQLAGALFPNFSIERLQTQNGTRIAVKSNETASVQLRCQEIPER
jgi:hypothetical protein